MHARHSLGLQKGLNAQQHELIVISFVRLSAGRKRQVVVIANNDVCGRQAESAVIQPE